MFQIIGTVDGVERLNRAFNRTEGFVADMRNFAPAIAQEFYRAEREQFQTEGSAGASGKWSPLSTPYARFKAERFPGETILRATGALEASLTDPDAFDAIFRADEREIVLGTKVPYARAHQRGAGRLPSRPPISLSETQKRRMQKAVQRQLIAEMRKLGFEVEEERAA